MCYIDRVLQQLSCWCSDILPSCKYVIINIDNIIILSTTCFFSFFFFYLRPTLKEQPQQRSGMAAVKEKREGPQSDPTKTRNLFIVFHNIMVTEIMAMKCMRVEYIAVTNQYLHDDGIYIYILIYSYSIMSILYVPII